MLTRIDLQKAKARLLAVDIRWLALATLASASVLAFRSLRFRLLTTRARLRLVTAAIGVQNFILRVTPFRLGELSLPIVLSRYSAEPAAHTLVSLFLVRLLELWVLLAAGVLAVLAFFGPGHAQNLSLALVALAAVSGLLLSFRFWMKLGVRATRGVIARARRRSLRRLHAFGERLEAAVEQTARLDARRLALLWSANVAVAAGQYIMLGCLTHAFGLHLRISQILVGVSLAQVASAIPLATVGTVGTYEAGWTLGFLAVGVGLGDAVVTAIATQVVTLIYAGLFALPSWLELSRWTPVPPDATPGRADSG